MSDVITNLHKASTARREAAMRRQVYPGRVAAGKMSQVNADRQIAIMDAIAADYAKLAEDEEKAERPTLL